jgi:uncharacterized membrane protein
MKGVEAAARQRWAEATGGETQYISGTLMEVLGAVLAAERVQARRSALRRHADLVLAAGRQDLRERAAVADLEGRYAALPRDL